MIMMMMIMIMYLWFVLNISDYVSSNDGRVLSGELGKISTIN